MSDEPIDSTQARSDRTPPPSSGARWYHSRPVRLGWIALRVLLLTVGLLVVARWMGAVWDNGWFKASLGGLFCFGVPTGFYVLILRQTKRLGGNARFGWLTVAALVNLPVLIWVGVRSPVTYLDALRDEGLDAVKWVASNVGHRAPEPQADPAGGDQTDMPADGSGNTGDGTGSRTSLSSQQRGDGAQADSMATQPSRAVPVVDADHPRGQAIPFESAAGQMIVRASINGRAPLPFILDTGASHSTLNEEALGVLGLEVPIDAPVRTMQTAGGETQGPMVLVDQVNVGDQRREGLGFWVCEPCALNGTVGLLGLNYWQGYLLTIDPVEQSIWLQPRDSSSSRTVDIEPYLDVSATSSRIADGKLIVDLELDNRAPRAIDQAVVLVQALDERDREIGAFTIEAGRIPARGRAEASGEMVQAGEVAQVKLQLLDAWW